ncbi:MAG: hypothetical protein JW888_04900 [Pirellulales bacterium]|nr:hypothetical protein [Pirellulales bacterium]
MAENRKHAVIPPGYRLGPVEDDPADQTGPAQFGIGGLLMVQAGFAIFLTLLMATGIFAVFAIFVLTILLQWGSFRLRNVALRRTVFDLMAGVGMPILCLWYDPLLFHDDNPIRVLAYLLIGFQILALLSWSVYDALTARPSGLFAGMLSVGCVLAAAIGITMLPLSLIGLVFLIGLLGFTPFLTAYVFGRNARRAMRLSPDDSRRVHNTLFVLGVVLAIGVPTAVYATARDVLAELLRQVHFPHYWLGLG